MMSELSLWQSAILHHGVSMSSAVDSRIAVQASRT